MNEEKKIINLRNEIGNYMTIMGEKSDKVVLVNADLSGTCRNGAFVEQFPERSFNTGIAEQNLVSFAAGLAHEGFIPYVFSMAPFITMRACEQCRTDVAYAGLPVRLIGVYAGVSGGISGATHWAIEDCGIMTSMPGMIVLEPSDFTLAKKMLNESLRIDKPIYMRVTVEPTISIYDESIEFKIGGSSEVVSGNDGSFLCTGVMVKYAIGATKIIKEKYNLNIAVVDMYSIKPIDKLAINKAIDKGAIIVAQDHNIYGGLGSMVANEIALSSKNVRFEIAGINDQFFAMAHAEYLYNLLEMNALGLANRMIGLLGLESEKCEL